MTERDDKRSVILMKLFDQARVARVASTIVLTDNGVFHLTAVLQTNSPTPIKGQRDDEPPT